jgi:ribonucleoside-diphosphate reductase alpha chain
MTERPNEVPTETIKVKTGCGDAYITISTDPDFYELYGLLGKTGGCAAAFLHALTTVISVAVQHGTPKESIIKQLKDIRCPQDSNFIPSCPEALARIMAAG